MIIFLVVLITLGIVVEVLSLKDRITYLEYSSVPSKLGCEPDEIFQIKTTVSNYSSKTISFLKMEEELPYAIHLYNVEKAHTNGSTYLHKSILYVQKRQKVTRTIRVSFPNRGLYYLQGCKFYSGDFLGLKENYKEMKQQEEIIIYPKALKDTKVQEALSGFYGDYIVKRFYIEDPILVNSFRDYTGREPMRSISWPQSAKRNHLMVKEFDHTLDMSVTILLDVYLHWSDGACRESIEYCFSLTRTIADYLEEKKISYRLLSNALVRSGNVVNDVLEKPGQGSRHYTMLLNTLGQAETNTFSDCEELYHMTISKYNGENTIFYIAPFTNDKREWLVQNLHHKLGIQIYPMYGSKEMEEESHVI
ncbi:MAG: DUF58 domain-containing protein [Anaerocolumna sp.]